jgi:hypothetical protein
VLQRRAAALIAFRSPVVFSFNHEPENDPAAGNASDFVAAHRHIHGVFQKAGVSNVTYAWTMMAWSFRSGNAAAYVDVVAADGYNQHGCPHGNAPWRSFGGIFAPFQAFGAAHGKPMIVAEWGAHACRPRMRTVGEQLAADARSVPGDGRRPLLQPAYLDPRVAGSGMISIGRHQAALAEAIAG